MTRNWIVAQLVNGQPLPSECPKVYVSLKQATKVARILAKNVPEAEFAVYQMISVSQANAVQTIDCWDGN